MARNIYVKRTVDNDKKLQVIQLVSEDRFKEASDILNGMVGDIHIGQLSVGYRFAFALNPDLYDVNDMKTVIKFLNTEGLKFILKYDEDIEDHLPGKEITAKEFFDMYNDSLKNNPVMYRHFHLSDCGINYCDLEGSWY